MDFADKAVLVTGASGVLRLGCQPPSQRNRRDENDVQ